MHRWIATDNGSQCIRCGMVLDYRTPDDEPNVALWIDNTEADTAFDVACDRAAHWLAPSCPGPNVTRTHHYVLEGLPGLDTSPAGFCLNCAYGDSVVTDATEYASIRPECVGA